MMTNQAAQERSVVRTVTLGEPVPGFGGPGHEMVQVVDAVDFADQDPFILLADDRLDMAAGAAVGGAHPHAGFEIATFTVTGTIDEGDEGTLTEGDVLWTTAGRGVIHGESVVPRGPTRILQLWVALPERDRWVEPHFDLIRRDAAPIRRQPGVLARVYGGASGDARVQRTEHTPVTMVDIALDAGAVLVQELTATSNGFLYVLDGSIRVGADSIVRQGQVGWLDRQEADGNSILRITGGDSGGRVVLYAGEPQRYPIATHGPFVGGSRADLMRMSRDYMDGRYVRMSELARAADRSNADARRPAHA